MHPGCHKANSYQVSEFLDSIARLFPETDGFCHPDWKAIAEQVESRFPREEWDEWFTEAALHWVELVVEKAKGEFYLHQTDNSILLSPESEEKVEAMCHFCESARKDILNRLKGIAKSWGYGKCVIFMFAGEQDYYQYISHFYKDGEHALSGGIFIASGGYDHLAFVERPRTPYQAILRHELAHSMVSHLCLPVWLNEALAMAMENRPFKLNAELLDRHRACWNEKNIQQFWSGTTYDEPKAQELSYHLAQVLLRKIQEDLHPSEMQMAVFVNVAHFSDAGEEACWRVFDLSLGDLMGDFLGPGHWAPVPEQWPRAPEAPPKMGAL